MSHLGRTAERLRLTHNPAGSVYGTIAVGALLAAENTHSETFRATLEGTIVALALYWLAHAYARLVGDRFEAGEGALTLHEMWSAMAHEWAIVKGASLPLLVVGVLWAAGAELRTAVTAGIWTSAVSVVGFEVVASGRTAKSPARRAAEIMLGVLLGGGLLLLRIILH